jgi:uncharacterized protein YdeI (YjbR/CyaY-like superfamily)
VADLPEKRFKDAAAFERWLAKHHDKVAGAWLVFARKNSGATSLSYAEAVEVALCYGWIDGQGKGIDERFTKTRFTPRARRSIWSKINTQHAERLVKEGRMKPAGLAEIDRAKADGRWDRAYDSPSTMTIPDDFAAALKKSRQTAAFDKLNSRNRYAMLFRIHDAKKPETRAARIDKFVEMLKNGETLY